MYQEIVQVLLQTAICAGVIWAVLRYHLHVEQPDPIKVGVVACAAVAILRFFASGIRESFIVEWGAVPKSCGGNLDDDVDVPPSHTAVSDIWSDQQVITNNRIEAALTATANTTKEIEDFLRVNVPNTTEQERGTTIQNV